MTAEDQIAVRTVDLVPHTHWDREWYEPFQRFRIRLVHLLDEVLDRAEADPGFCFTLDGQIAAVDDYLEVRPEARERVAALVRSGQIAVGPWQILLDEFLCSGENIVRNLEMGWRRASELGAAMPVGYLPDMFGHVAQMPQVLARAGLRHACVWRGVPASVQRHAFRWAAPDGSWVRAEYLSDGYGNGVDLFAAPDRLAVAVELYEGRARARFGDDPVLAMFGTDHMAPLPTLMDLVRGLRDAPVRMRVTTLADYMLARDPDEAGMVTITGEMRSHARANVLPGVVSVRVWLKQALGRAERMVERYAEPLAALFSETDHGRFLDMAWQRLVDASCHDSVTGCGVDETAVQVAARVAEAEQLGQAVRDQVLAPLALAIPRNSVLVVNPTPRTRTGLVEIETAAPDVDAPLAARTPDGLLLEVQELSRTPELLGETEMPGSELARRVLARIHRSELYGQPLVRADIGDGVLDLHVATHPADAVDITELTARLEAVAAKRPTWRVRVLAEPRRRVLAAVTVPPLGTTALVVEAGSVQVGGETARDTYLRDPVWVEGGRRLVGSALQVDVADDGTLAVTAADGTDLRGVGRLVDGGDRGDSYNYAPPANETLVDAPGSVTVTVVERGPLRAVLDVRRTYTWPAGLADADRDMRSSTQVGVETVTRVELRTGEPFVRLTVWLRNPAADHRLRLHVPLPVAAASSAAEGQFAVVERGLINEGGCGEEPLPTFPASAFVGAGDAVVLLDSVTEYELVDGGCELALTLLRSIGWLSVNVHALRDEPAGPQLPVPAAQHVGGEVMTRLAVMPAAGGWTSAGALEAAEVFRHDLVAVPGTGVPGALPAPAAGLALEGNGVVLSSLRPRAGHAQVRVVAMTAEPTMAVLRGRFTGARRIDLLGRDLDEPLTVVDGTVELPLGPWEIATLALLP